MPLFDRAWRLIVGVPGQQGVQIDSGEKGNSDPHLRITFQIDKTTKATPNKSKVTVFNLAPDTRAFFERPDNVVRLYAGYWESDGPKLIAAGNVTFGYTQRDGADFLTTLEMHDGQAALRDTMVSIGLGKGASAQQVIRFVAAQMGLPLLMPASVPDRIWEHGFSYYGPGRNALRKATDGAGLEWSIQNEVIQVLARNGTTTRQVIEISPDSGMIKSPERKREGAKETAKVRDLTTGALPVVKTVAGLRPHYDGWHVNSLLMPELNPGDTVMLTSIAVKAPLRIEKLKHVGDSFQGDWQTSMDLLDPKDYAAEQAAIAAKKAKAAARAEGGGH